MKIDTDIDINKCLYQYNYYLQRDKIYKYKTYKYKNKTYKYKTSYINNISIF